MRLSYFPLLLLLTTYGCGGDGRSTPSVLQIGGQWSFTESYTDTSLSTTCTNQATVTFAQNGSNFSGSSVQTGTCTEPTGTFDNSGNFQLRNGRVDGSTASWNDDGAPVGNYTGAISGTPANRMSGTVRCNGVVGGVGLRCQGYVADDSLT